MAIPKIIHFCWFSDDSNCILPENVNQCIETWKTNMPDYSIMYWNQNNFDVTECQYVREAFEAKKYAFVSDYVRLAVLKKYGGIYFDTDVKVIKSFDELLSEKGFFSFEKNNLLATCVIACEPNDKIIAEALNDYKTRQFVKDDSRYNLTPNTVYVTELMQKKGLKLNGCLQTVENITIFPAEYFSPFDKAADEMNITNNTYSIHLFDESWVSVEKKTINLKRKQIIKKYGKLAGYIYYGVSVIKNDGIKQFVQELKIYNRK